MKTPQLLTLATLLTLSLILSLGCEAPELDVPEGTATVAEEPIVEKPAMQVETKPTEPREVTGHDGKKGKLSREQGGYLGSVLGAGMYAQHQVIFLQVKNAINLDYGLNGDFPKSHEEFMERVIKFNKIQLPELSEGDEYLYDPEDHTLKIYRPGTDAKVEHPDGQYIGDVAMGQFFIKHKNEFDTDEFVEAAKRFVVENNRQPESHQEFMEKIVKANQLQLPKLDPGMEYFYDSEVHTLKIYGPEN